MATMHIDMEPNETVSVGAANITFEQKSGRKVRVKIEVPADVVIKLPRDKENIVKS